MWPYFFEATNQNTFRRLFLRDWSYLVRLSFHYNYWRELYFLRLLVLANICENKVLAKIKCFTVLLPWLNKDILKWILQLALINAVSGSLICQPDFKNSNDLTRRTLTGMAESVIQYDPEFVLKVLNTFCRQSLFSVAECTNSYHTKSSILSLYMLNFNILSHYWKYLQKSYNLELNY